MNILADANIEGALVRWLRSIQCNVIWACELPPSTPDSSLMDLANETQSVLLTYDRDFGELVFRQRQIAHGIVLLRFTPKHEAPRLALLQRHWQTVVRQSKNHFTVVNDSKVRVRPLM
jgi:predicted nuclease of predicted toxin-antitoxin system